MNSPESGATLDPELSEGTVFFDELLVRAAEERQDEALLAPGRTPLTFAELLNRAGAVAGSITDTGLGRNDVVATVMADGPDLLTSILGVAAVAICAPVNPALRKTEMESCLRRLGARALIVDRSADSPAREIAEELGISVFDAERAFSFSAPTGTLTGGRDSDIAVLLETSATTGKPRLVPLTHLNLRAMAANTRQILQLTEQDRFLSMMPLFHLTGLLSSLATLLAGGSVVSTAGFDAGMFVSWLEQFHPTWYTATPTLHHAIVPLMETRPDVLARFPLRFVRSIGAPLPRDLRTALERVLGAPVLEGYGLTEAGMVTSNAPPPRKRKPESVGQSGGVEIAILDDGEIAVRGPAVIHGYYHNAAADRSAFRNGWLLTGDAGHLDDEGFLFVTGRIKDIINRGGEKVLPAEIDEVLAAHPSVSEAVAFGVAHATLGEDVAAAVVLVPGARRAEKELRRFASQRLAGFKVPRRIIFVDAIPKGPTGKAQRAALAERFHAIEASLAQNPDQPLTPVEKKLEKIWTRILRVEEAGVHDDFFQAGGDSLALTLLLTEIECEFGVEESLIHNSEFFLTPTIKTLADAIARGMNGATVKERSPLIALQPLGSRSPFFCIPGADENPYYFLDLASGVGRDQPFYALRDPQPLEERGAYTLEEHAGRFASAIRLVQPHGPYTLGGHCYGGILAYEAARQLIASGEQVSLLALFEVPTPGYPKLVRNWRNYLEQSKRLLAELARGEIRQTWTDVRSHGRVVMGLLKKKGRVLGWRRSADIGLPLKAKRTCSNERAGRTYQPKPLHCKVVHFLAADEAHSTLVLDDPRLGWRDYVGPGFSTESVPGIADGIFKQPNVPELASKLRDLLDGVHSRA
jgi:acyl-CoA synthetase (AMP-forming)/AMP-acid ligase II/thioesterase domain-containing protein